MKDRDDMIGFLLLHGVSEVYTRDGMMPLGMASAQDIEPVFYTVRRHVIKQIDIDQRQELMSFV